MKLSEYPKAIAEIAKDHLEAQVELYPLKEELRRLNQSIDLEVAEAGLKNEDQRKAKRAELEFESDDYKILRDKIQYREFALKRIQIEWDLLVNEFTVAKLEARNRVASLEALTE